jgi:hypothetical protein
MKLLVHINEATGGIIIEHPMYDDALRQKDETEDELLERVAAKVIPPGKSYFILDLDDPTVLAQIQDRTFRDAWEWSD